MRTETHLAGGALVATLGAGVIPAPGNLFFAVGALLGSVAPDSDIANPLGKISARIGRVGKRSGGMLSPARIIAMQIQVLAWVLGAILTTVAAVFSLGHRKEMHSAWIAIFLMLAFAPLAVLVAPEFYALVGLGAGWMMHRALDSLTPSGIMWGKWRVRGPIRTGSLWDRVVGGVLLLVSILVFLSIAQIRNGR